MAYMTQENKAKLAAAAKPILKKYGLKGSFSVSNGSGIKLKIKSGTINFIENFNQTMENRGVPSYGSVATDCLSVNPYWYKEHFTGKALAFLKEIFLVLNKGNYDNSDSQSDYFDIGWYVYLQVGSWNKPYILEK